MARREALDLSNAALVKAPAELRVDRICARLRERGLYTFAAKVALAHHVTVPEMLGSGRTKSIVTARHAFLCGVHDMAGLSWPEIGAIVERRHDNIIHASSKRESRARRDMSRTLECEIAAFVRGSTYGSVAELADAIASGVWRSSTPLLLSSSRSSAPESASVVERG